ncbi:MAG TPA: hypothetical protein VGR35_12125 [Tepidisphaeraceae bacterium]|nr:hypothetical protein [Tepidisphaeraceae bacterium]
MAILHDVLGRYVKVGPGRFLVTGVWLFALKFLIDRLVATVGFGRPWSPLNYLVPNEVYGLPFLPAPDRVFYATMLAVALPFVWIGIVLTLRRLTDAGLPRWLAVLFFVPAANLLFFAALGVIPSARKPAEAVEAPTGEPVSLPPAPVRAIPLEYGHDDVSRRPLARLFPESPGTSALLAILLPVPLAVGLAFLAARVFRDYGWGVFVAMPFVVGMISAVLHGYRTPRTMGQCLTVGSLALVASGAGMITFALEGLGCLIMCAPIAFPIALLGAALGYSIQARAAGDAGLSNALWTVLLCTPLLMGAESVAGKRATYFAVRTCIDVNAPPMRVWHNVVTFSDIPKPSDWVFRAGVAFPVRARIDGSGVGAIRYCQFSTGDFIEPIEVWDEGRLLKFAVTENPPPMREWSPYAQVHPPHLENFLVARGGQFKLIELPGRRTRLEGTTWYRHTLWPETYWRWWSDFIIHRIHRRVLEHVKTLSESQEQAASNANGS